MLRVAKCSTPPYKSWQGAGCLDRAIAYKQELILMMIYDDDDIWER